MEKVFKDSKWWFYLPLISLCFTKSMVLWVFEPNNNKEMYYRYTLLMYVNFIHVIPIIYLIQILCSQ